MKLFSMSLGTLLFLTLLVGCVKKPVEFKPQSQDQTTVMTFVKQKVSNMVIVNIAEAPKPQNLTGKFGGIPPRFRVELSDPNDDSLRTIAVVSLDLKTGQVNENEYMPPSPPTKAAK